MNPELEALLESWDAYLQAAQGQEAERLLALYDARLDSWSYESCCSQVKFCLSALTQRAPRTQRKIAKTMR